MSLSIPSNKAAMIALRNLNAASNGLQDVQGRVGTGLRVAGARDNPAGWADAQDQRADITGYAAVKMGLSRAQSIGDMALTAGNSIADILAQMKEKVVAAQDRGLLSSSRQALQSDFQQLLRQVTQIVQDAAFDGARLLDNSIPGGLGVIADPAGASTLTLANQNMQLGGGIITLSAGASILGLTSAKATLSLLNASIGNVSLALAEMGVQVKQIESHNAFVSLLSDSIEGGVGNLVDADLSKESARLQALRIQQQLGTEVLSISNQSPQVILSLFRNS